MEHLTGDHAGLRVILVGKTGLDAALRLDPEVELIRARTPLDAIGELADPLDAANPGRAVVIVDPGVEPTTGPGSLAEFLAGLRRVDPAVRVLRVARNGGSLPNGYDGAVGAENLAAALRDFIASGARTPAASDTAIETKPPVPVSVPDPITPLPPPPVATPRADQHEPSDKGHASDETGLLRSIIDGESVLEPALAAIRSRTGAADVQFVETGAEPAPAGWGAWISAPVKAGACARVVGELRSRGAGAASLEREAAWLGAWLELERRQRDLSEAAYRDPLTGAWNRRYFDDFLPRAMEEARRHRRSLTILFFDIDDFKRYNDRYGHAAGDEILTECVRMMLAVVRPTDKVCRVGGDEFAVVFYEPQGPRAPDSRHPSSVFDIAERFRSQVRSAHFRKLADEAPGCLTISGGLATFPWDGRTPQELVERADQLALEGKRQGKNVIAIGPGCRRLGEE